MMDPRRFPQEATLSAFPIHIKGVVKEEKLFNDSPFDQLIIKVAKVDFTRRYWLDFIANSQKYVVWSLFRLVPAPKAVNTLIAFRNHFQRT